MSTLPSEGAWSPSASRNALERRAQLLSDIRQFFVERKVLEVETPVLSQAGNPDPSLDSMALERNPRQWLRTSPEFPLKRLLASGSGDIYEMGRVFRAGESGRHHNPEFTLLEWYRVGWNYRDLAREVVDLIRFCGGGMFDRFEVRSLTYREFFLDHTGLDPWFAAESDWEMLALERGIEQRAMDPLQWQDLMLASVIQPSMPPDSITVLLDYPPERAALARIRDGAPPVAERFEVYLGPIELANGYQELTDPEEQRRRFDGEARIRQARGEEAPAIDGNLIRALRHGLPECAGVALGVDRLLMACCGLSHIDAVLAFPAERA